MQSSLIHNTLTIRVKGDMDHFSVGILRSEIDREIREKPIKNLVFDLSELEFMDSSGIGMVLGRYKTVSTLGGRIILFGMSAETERIMKMSGIDRIAEIY